MPRFAWRSILLSAAVLCFASAVRAQENRIDEVLKQLEQVHSFSSVSISPDGNRVAWVEGNSTESNSGKGNTVYLLDWKKAGAKPKRVPNGEPLENPEASEIAWSPDNRQIAFLSHGSNSQDQIYTASAENGKSRCISNLDGHVKGLRWGANAQQLIFLYAEHGGGGGPLEAEPAQTGVIGAGFHNQRLTLMSTDGSGLRQITPSELNVYEYDMSPDGKQFAAIAAPGPADNNWWTAKLYTVPVESGKMDLIYAPPVERQIAAPHWSPDGSKIGFLGGLMSDEGFDGGDIFVVPARGGQTRNLTEGSKATPTGLQWRNNGTILYTESLDGGGAIATLNLSTGETEVLWKGGQELHQDGNFPNLSIARDGVTSAAIRSTWESAPEICAGAIGDWKALTRGNAEQKPRWGKAESITWQSEANRVQGWLLYPEHFEAGKRYPMVVSIHGGPSGVRSASWPSVHFDMSVMASLGYFVFFPNPARKLWRRRDVHAREYSRFRGRRPA